MLKAEVCYTKNPDSEKQEGFEAGYTVGCCSVPTYKIMSLDFCPCESAGFVILLHDF